MVDFHSQICTVDASLAPIPVTGQFFLFLTSEVAYLVRRAPDQQPHFDMAVWEKGGKQGLLCITHTISPEQSTHPNALKALWDSQREEGVTASSVCRGSRAASEDH